LISTPFSKIITFCNFKTAIFVPHFLLFFHFNHIFPSVFRSSVNITSNQSVGFVIFCQQKIPDNISSGLQIGATVV